MKEKNLGKKPLVEYEFVKQLDDLPYHIPEADLATNVMSEVMNIEKVSPLYTSSSVPVSGSISIFFYSISKYILNPFGCCAIALTLVLIYLVSPTHDTFNIDTYAFTIAGDDGRDLATSGEKLLTAQGEVINLALGENLGAIVIYENSVIETVDGGVHLHKGKAYFDLSLNGRTFNIGTSEGTVTVFGTAFLVSLDNEGLTVTVDEGIVSFNNKMNAVKIPSGKYLRVTKETIGVFAKRTEASSSALNNIVNESTSAKPVTSESLSESMPLNNGFIPQVSGSLSNSGYNETEGGAAADTIKSQKLPLSGIKATVIQSTSDLEHIFGN